MYQSKNEIVSSRETKWQWQRGELQDFLRQIFSTLGMRSTSPIVDGLDECDEKGVRDVVYSCRDLTDLAFEKDIRLNVCVSSRHYPTITIPRCPEIIVENRNREDIEMYIKARMTALEEDDSVLEMQAEIISKANGIFLWVVIVVQVLLTEWDNDGTVQEMNRTLHKVTGQLSKLFASLFTTLNDEERDPAVILFQLLLVSENMDTNAAVLRCHLRTTSIPLPTSS
jgi:protein SERAC1